MKQSYQALTLKNVLSDPMVRTAMAADRVDAHELAAMLAGVAKTLAPSPPRLSARLAQFFCPN
jgi:hypothetical protein